MTSLMLILGALLAALLILLPLLERYAKPLSEATMGRLGIVLIILVALLLTLRLGEGLLSLLST